MSIFLSIIVITLCLISFFLKKEKLLLWVFVLTLINGMFEFNIGSAVKVYHFITLLYLPRIIKFYIYNPLIKRKFKPLIIEFIIMMLMGILFGFIFKFDDPFKQYRTVTQLSEWRTLISGGRFILELFSILLVTYWLQSKIFSINYIFKVIGISTIITVLLAFIIYYTGGITYRTLFPYWDYVADRLQYMYDFRGLVGEPKTFGRTCAFLLISMLLSEENVSKSIRLFAILLSLVGIIFSLSASGFIVAAVGLALFFITKRKMSNLFFLILVSLSLFLTFKYSNQFNYRTLSKIQYVLASNNLDRKDEGKVRPNEPDLFTRFEIFDRAALNFLYFNPQYLLFGVGPNTVSIPASQYLTYRMQNSEVHGYGINTAPATLFVNILSRSGLCGLFLYLIFLIGIFKGLINKNDKTAFVILTVMVFITNTTIILLFYGIFLYLSNNYTKFRNQNNFKLKQNYRH